MRKTSPGLMVVALLAGCSGGGTAVTPQGIADAWPTKWCQAEPGNTREQLVAIMGQPTDALASQLSWSAHHYRFIAFLDADGTVKQLDINLSALSDAEKASLKCSDVRTRKSMAARAATPPRMTPDACKLVSAAEMSRILRTVVVAKATSRLKCLYKPDAAISPYVELSVGWGDAQAAMRGIGLAEKRERGLTSPYDGIGDQAVSVGPALMIQTGEDLVTIVFSGVTDTPTVAKQIFDTAKANM